MKQDGQVRSLRVLLRAQNAEDESTSQGPPVGTDRRKRVSFLKVQIQMYTSRSRDVLESLQVEFFALGSSLTVPLSNHVPLPRHDQGI